MDYRIFDLPIILNRASGPTGEVCPLFNPYAAFPTLGVKYITAACKKPSTSRSNGDFLCLFAGKAPLTSQPPKFN